jgi:hypothetical protein
VLGDLPVAEAHEMEAPAVIDRQPSRCGTVVMGASTYPSALKLAPVPRGAPRGAFAGSHRGFFPPIRSVALLSRVARAD